MDKAYKMSKADKASGMNGMNDLIERYVYDVVRRLPEKERDEVGKELKSNIYDMLPDDAVDVGNAGGVGDLCRANGPDESEIAKVLYTLGPPAALAEQYRQKPRYLISPAVYDDYVRVLKWVVPLVGIVVLVIGMILGAIEGAGGGAGDLLVSDIIRNVRIVLTQGITMGVEAAFQALLWTTVGFVIAERAGVKAGAGKKREWRIEDLPSVPSDVKGKIPLSDSVAEMALTVIFAVAAIFLCSGMAAVFTIGIADTEAISIFNDDFLAMCIPAIAVMAVVAVCECIIKIRARRWTPVVCGAVLTSSLICMCIMLFLVNSPDMFSVEFLAFLRENEWGSHDLLRFAGTRVANPIPVILSVVIVVCSIVECGKAVCKTLKPMRESR